MSIRRLVLTLGLIGLGLGVGIPGATAQQAQANMDAKTAKPLTSTELYHLYNSRSWLWDKGAGYFSVKKRKFIAWSGKGSDASYGVGLWFITAPGKLCFRAEWHAKSGVAPAVTCFSHRQKDGVVFQKREPDGEWYVFRSAPARRSNEYAKLRRGDYVSAEASKIEARLSAAN